MKKWYINLYGYKRYNGIKCAVGEFKFSDVELKTEIWIDAKTGACLKTINKGIRPNGEEYEIIDEYVATYGTVTDADVKKPDLRDYKFIEVDGEIDKLNNVGNN